MTKRHHIPRVRALVGVAATATLLVVPSAAAAPVTGIDALDDTVDTVDSLDGSNRAGSRSARPRQAGEALVGTFRITAGECGGDGVNAGSYFRMATPAGNPENGPWVNNSSSPCDDNTYTPLSPGTDGGLSTEGYQPHPEPAFDDGDALADRIIQPTGFNGTDFSAATNPVDPQAEEEVPVPSIDAAGGDLSGQVTAWAAAWNNQHFNQGSPKPDGDQPGDTFGPTGTYDPATGAFTLEWASLIVGGPFNNFTGVWHLEGTFEAAAGGGGSDGSTTTTPGTSTTGPGGSGGASGDADPTTETGTAGSGPTPRTGGPLPALAALALTGGGFLSRRFLTSAR